MSIFRKIKLALFSSGFILASYNASAMTEEGEKGQLPKGLPVIEPLHGDSNELTSSSSPLPQHVVDELSARLARVTILNGSKGESSSPLLNVSALNESEEGMTTSSSSPPPLKTSSIRKDALDDIAGRLSPIGSALKTFLAPSPTTPSTSLPTSPQTKRKSVSSSTSPREKRKSSKVRGRKNTPEISSPPPNSTKNTSIEDYQEELPNFLREFSDKFKAVDYMSLSREEQERFYQLLCSFRDVEQIYKDHINPEYFSTIEDLYNDLHNITVVDTTRRFRLIRSATASYIKEEAEKAAARKAAAEEAAHQVVGEASSGADGTEGFTLSRGPSLSSSPPSSPLSSPPLSPPLSPRGKRSFPSSAPPIPPGFSKNEPSASAPLLPNPILPPLSLRGKGSLSSSRPLPIPPGLSKNDPSVSAPSLLLRQEEPSSSRPLPVSPSEKNPSSSISVSPPLSLSAPPRPSRSRSISTPVRKMGPATSSSPTSPPPNKRWANYSKSPVDLSGQYDESDQSD
jgi:hypothetical protein